MKCFAALLAGALLMLTTATAQATYTTLTTAQLLTATEVETNSVLSVPFFSATSMPQGVEFTDLIGRGPTVSTVYSYVGVDANTYGLTDLSAFDSFKLNLSNTNNSIWDIALFIRANEVNYFSPFQTLAPNPQSQQFSIDLASLSANVADVEFLGFAVRSQLTGGPLTLGNPSNPDFYHVTAAPVPEPGTMMLLGAGFLGLAIYGKRRRNV